MSIFLRGKPGDVGFALFGWSIPMRCIAVGLGAMLTAATSAGGAAQPAKVGVSATILPSCRMKSTPSAEPTAGRGGGSAPPPKIDSACNGATLVKAYVLPVIAAGRIEHPSIGAGVPVHRSRNTASRVVHYVLDY